MSGNIFVEEIAQIDGVETVSATLLNKGKTLRFKVESEDVEKINKGSEVHNVAQKLVIHLINNCGWTLERASCYIPTYPKFPYFSAEFIRE